MVNNLLCLFTGQIEEQLGSFVVELPKREVELGAIEPENSYRIALIPTVSAGEAEPEISSESTGPNTPVEEGDTVEVEIENLGDQGDGIARVGPGYVVIIPDTSPGDRVTVEIDEARENVAFAEVVERHKTTM